ncbi:MAG: methyltransferase domain-containing protein [Planctomycetes bacterium]|nr:methyltransferase domain-containing protein [Planctomycetota bacterium]
MDHKEAGKYWDGNAEAWTKLSRMGCDTYRDHVNTPAFLSMLPDVKGLNGLDIGCGEGHNTRKVAEQGAYMSAIDISSVFIKLAKESEEKEPLGIQYQAASAIELPFDDDTFDFAMATMSFMDIPETEEAIKETWRVLKPSGFLQFSLLHPCFFTPKREWIRDENNKQIALKCGDYFRELRGGIDQWIFSTTPKELRNKIPEFKTPYFYLTLSKWLNRLIDAGFVLEHFAEPKADNETVKRIPHLADTQIIAYFLIIRCRKPGDK